MASCCKRPSKSHHVKQKSTRSLETLEEGTELRLLSFNAFCRPPGIKNKANDWKTERLMYLAKHEMHNFDIVAMQELFGTFSGRRDTFLKSCAESGHSHYVTSPKPSWKFLIDGGLAIVSKYPIVESEWRPFAPGMHSDRLAEKGILHAKVALNVDLGLYLHVFNAHTQSSYNDPVGTPSWKIRERQTQVMLKFMEEVTANDSYPAVLMGDLNIDARKEMPKNTSSTEYKAFLDLLKGMKSSRGAHDPEPVGFVVQDVLYDFNNNEHPITFGDAIIGPNNEVKPLEIVFTKAHDYGTFQCLDYIFWMTRPGYNRTGVTEPGKRLAGDKGDKSAKPSHPKILAPKNSLVAKLFVEGQHFTQLSDHYGAEAVFEIN